MLPSILYGYWFWFCVNDIITGDKVLKTYSHKDDHKHIPRLNVSLPMGFDLFLPIALDIQVWASVGSTLEWCQNKGLGMGHNITKINY